MLDYSFASESTFDSKTLLLGGFFDYNFNENIEGKTWVPGVRLKLGAGQEDNSSLSKAYSLTSVQLGLILKYFSFHSDFAVFGELAGGSDSATLEDTSIKTTGSSVRMGIINYF